MLGTIQRMWTTFTRWAGHTRSYMFAVVHRGVERLRVMASMFAHRHRSRWIAESTYRRTIVAAVVAVGSTLLPHPVAAAALGALLADHLPTRRWESYDDEEDDTYPRRSRRLWDTYE